MFSIFKKPSLSIITACSRPSNIPKIEMNPSQYFDHEWLVMPDPAILKDDEIHKLRRVLKEKDSKATVIETRMKANKRCNQCNTLHRNLAGSVTKNFGKNFAVKDWLFLVR